MVVRLDERNIDEMLALQAQCLAIHDLFLPTSREGYLRSFQYNNFCYGYRLSPKAELLAFLNCTIPTQNAKINFGKKRLSSDQLNRVGHMNTLLVRRDARKRGIGKDLVETCLQEFLKRNGIHIYVTVNPENMGSIRLLRSMNFRSVDTVQLLGQQRELLYKNLLDEHPKTQQQE